MRAACFGHVPVLNPFRGPVPLRGGAVPGRLGDVGFAVVTSARHENTARITRLYWTGDPPPLLRSWAPGTGVVSCPEHRENQYRKAYERHNHGQDDPRRGSE